MITVEEAQEQVLEKVNILERESALLLEVLGQVLAEDVISGIDIPPLDNSAMDGYAVRAEDTIGAGKETPRVLRVVDTVPAGSISEHEVTTGTAIRIMTGAPVPSGSDSIVRFEDTDEENRRHLGQPIGEIGVMRRVKKGADIRSAGEDITRGATVLKRGTVIRPAEVGVLASLGHTTVNVIRRPVVAILATGDELTELGQPLPPGKIYNSNTYSLAALVKRNGGIPLVLGIARDNEKSLTEKIHKGLEADMLITTGGVSLGDYDIVKDILAREGEIGFWTVRMKPGKPLAFGTFRNMKNKERPIPHLGLPGNPVSTMITFELFVRPAMLKMMGRKNFTKPQVTAVLEDTLTNTDGRRVYCRVIVEKRDGKFYARSTGEQGSGILTSMSLANGLAIIPEDRSKVARGETARVLMLDWTEES